MAQVKCPVCGEWVYGGNTDDLSSNLVAHLSANHDFSGGEWLIEPVKKTKQIEMEGEEASERTEELRKHYEIDRSIGETVVSAVDCPVCGRLIGGENEDDLSDNLKEHVKERHTLAREERMKRKQISPMEKEDLRERESYERVLR